MKENLSPTDGINKDDEQSLKPDQLKLRPKLIWDLGTAYDLFVSIDVLHFPEKMGLRPSWAAGVRSRLSAEDRKPLEESVNLIGVPFHWIHSLPEPKDVVTALWTLRQLEIGQRLSALSSSLEIPASICEIVQNVAVKKSWDERDIKLLRGEIEKVDHDKKTPKDLESLLKAWAQPVDFGERYLQALQSYYQAFFAEEERHIAPILKEALERAQELSEKVSLDELLEELSQGLRLPGFRDVPELVLAPSFWSTPLVFLGKVSKERSIILFGARPMNASLIPGEVVPEALLRVLKALADPTRLRILRYLVCEQLTPVEISRRLRLRAPTVTHHLSELRLAGLVHITLVEHAERRYAARMEAVQGMTELLEDFLQCSKAREVE